MFIPTQYRAKATEYGKLVKTTDLPHEVREFQELERCFTELANNEEWLADNFDKAVRAPDNDQGDGETAAKEEERILRYLGAAVIMQWNALPRKLRRELFDTAGSMGDLLHTPALRGKIARFLHKYKDDAH
ncbi:MAG: hypothetical protein HY659_04890 [Rhizobiales bacterium]|nr:hypothetical protein [Hyphomicrobiales bacterium]